MRINLVAVAAAAVVALSGTASATLFSFASDSNASRPTFVGGAGAGGSFTISDAGPLNTFVLLIDDNNGPLPAFSVQTRLQASFSASFVTTIPIGGPTVQHVYRATGSFSFVDISSGLTLLSAAVQDGVFSVPGTVGAWSSTGSLLGSDLFTNVDYLATQALVDRMISAGADPAAYGIVAGPAADPSDFAFELSVLSQVGGGTVAIDSQTKLPTTRWESESSYSGSAINGFIPAPGAGVLMALAGVLASRRRRA